MKTLKYLALACILSSSAVAHAAPPASAARSPVRAGPVYLVGGDEAGAKLLDESMAIDLKGKVLTPGLFPAETQLGLVEIDLEASTRDDVGMMSFADDVQHYLSPRQGRGQFYRMLEFLYAVEPQPVEPDYRKALAYLAVKQRRRALVVVFTDLTGGASLNSLVAQMSMLARSSLPC